MIDNESAAGNVIWVRAAVRQGMEQWLCISESDIITMKSVQAPDEVLNALFDGTGLVVGVRPI